MSDLATLLLLAVAEVNEGELVFRVIAGFSFLGNAILLYRSLTGKAEARKIEPQPFEVSKAKEFTTRESFERHAEINRDEHFRIEKEADEAIKELRASLESASKEVSALTARQDISERLMESFAHELKEVAKTCNEMAGQLIRAAREASR